MPASMIKVQFFDSIYFPTSNDYTFCPHCGVDVTIYSHEDDCPSVRHRHNTSTDQNTTAAVIKN